MDLSQPQVHGKDAVEAPAATPAGMALLAAGVPLTLLLDLALSPRSEEIAATEGGSASWLRRSA